MDGSNLKARPVRAGFRPWYWLLAVVSLVAAGTGSAAMGPALRFGVAQVLPFHDPQTLAAWADYLGDKLDRPVHLVHRRSHTEILDLLVQGRLDLAWICPAHFRRHQQRMELIAGPVAQGRQEFQLLVLTPAQGVGEIDSLLDLQSKVIAFAEQDTNLGSAVVERALRRLGAEPEHFFRRVIYTGDHDRVIRAVAGGIAHAGAVMDQAWAAAQRDDPRQSDQLKVIWRSGWRPLPPLVAAPFLTADTTDALRQALTGMERDARGRALLKAFGFDRFVTPDPTQYWSHTEVEGPAVCGE